MAPTTSNVQQATRNGQRDKSLTPTEGGLRTVPVTLPSWVWGRVATIAEESGRPVAGIIADAIRGVLDDNPRTQFERVTRLGILESELLAARAAGMRAPGTHTSTKGRRVADR